MVDPDLVLVLQHCFYDDDDDDVLVWFLWVWPHIVVAVAVVATQQRHAMYVYSYDSFYCSYCSTTRSRYTIHASILPTVYSQFKKDYLMAAERDQLQRLLKVGVQRHVKSKFKVQ